MLTRTTGKKDAMVLCTMEQLVPSNHILRKIERTFDFDFIYDIVKPYYCLDNGRNSIDPVVLFKIMFIQILFGIKSLRQTIRDIEVNAAYRWFLGIPFGEAIPHFSTIGKNYQRRYKGTDVYEQIFKTVLTFAISKRYVDGEEIFTDSTHIKANANKRKFDEVMVEVINEKKQALEDEINSQREELKKKKKLVLKDRVQTKKIKVSKTDPESGYYYRDEKEKGFMYLDHRTVDGRHNIIIDTHITPGNVHDSVPIIDRLKHIDEHVIPFNQIALDSGYHNYDVMKYLEENGKFSVIAHRRFPRNKEVYPKSAFLYDPKENVYTCPEGLALEPRTVNGQGYIEYHSEEKVCRDCPLRDACIGAKNSKRVIRRHVYEEYKERNTERRLSPQGKGLYSRRKCTIEISFANSKENHGYRYAQFRGLRKNQDWSWLLCAVQNMKTIAYLEARNKNRHTS